MAAGFVVWFGATGVTSTVMYPMKWSPGEPPLDANGEHHVVLRFVDFLDHYVGFYSSELAEYLASLPTSRVSVEFEITRDFGRVRGYHVARIGALAGWRSGSSYSGHGESYDPAPW